MLDVILDALLDSIKTFPFLLLIYILMEVIENAKHKEKIENALSGYFAPVIASVVGVIPECGFAVVCAKLYDKKMIKTGTLISAFIAISDEGLIVLFGAVHVKYILLIIGIKVLYAVIVGEILNFLFRNFDAHHVCPEKDECIECGEIHRSNVDKFFLHPLFHSLKTFVYILVLNFLFGSLIYLIGEEHIIGFMDKNSYFVPLISPIVGLIPNCASSMFLSSAFASGVLSFSGLLAGLASNAGIGLIIIFKNGKNLKRNVIIVMLLYVLAVILGYITLAFGINNI